MTVTVNWLQSGTYPARVDRQIIAATHHEGVMNLSHFKVGPRVTGGPGMFVDVSAGEAVVGGDDEPNQGSYFVDSNAVETPAIAVAPASNSRYDLVVLRVNDENAGGALGNNAQIAVLTGTAAAAPAVPTLPPSAIPLARIGPIGVGKTSIQSADILDLRPLAGFRDTPGVMKDYTGDRVPNGWGLCDGGEVLRVDNPGLLAMWEPLGFPYGAGNGSTTMNKPNARGRATYGRSLAGTLAIAGVVGGSESVAMSTAHMPSHTHTTGDHSHTMAHTHPIDHDHPSFTSGAGTAHSHSFSATTAANGQHTHLTNPLGGNFVAYTVSIFQTTYVEGAGGTSFKTGGSVFGSNMTSEGSHNHTLSGTTGTEAAHTHNINVPPFVGTSGAASTSGTGAASAGTTGATGSGTPLPILSPYLVVHGKIIALG